MSLYFISGSEEKFNEVKKIIPDLIHLSVDLTEIQEVDPHKIINAKLNEATKVKNGELIIEDTSLYLDCMNGLPGPLIKWFMQTLGPKGIFELSKKMGNESAEAKTIVGYSDGNEVLFFEGAIKGKIVEPKGAGFGWDVIFMPINATKRFSEMTKEEKNKISMRGSAFNKLKDHLDQKN